MKKILLFACGLFFCLNLAAQGNLEKGLQYYNWREYKTALPYLQSAAKEGYGEACYLLGEMYYYGLGTEKNPTIAMRMYQRGIEYGFTKGEAELGRMYENGEGVTKDSGKAFSFYLQSSSRGNLLGKYLLARSYYHGLGTSEDNEKAFAMFYSLSKNTVFEKEYKWAHRWTYVYLGHCYKSGYGTPQDLEQAVISYYRSDIAEYLFRAAQLVEEYKLSIYPNGGSSLFRLSPGYLYELAVRNGFDNAEAYYKKVFYLSKEKPFYNDYIKDLLKSAEMGYGPAQKLLGDWYKEGKGIPVNLVKAREWYAKAKANGEEVPE